MSDSVTNDWNNLDTKVKAEYFNNFTSTNGATVTLTANWVLILNKAKTNSTWNVWSKPGYIMFENDIIRRTSTGLMTHEYGGIKWTTSVTYHYGTMNGEVLANIDSNGKLYTGNSDCYKYIYDKVFLKIYILNDSENGFSQYTENSRLLLKDSTDKVTYNGKTYYGVWVDAECTLNETTCPSGGLSIIT